MNKKQIEKLHEKIIDTILSNPLLNISYIPDELERELYLILFREIQENIIDGSCSKCPECNLL